MSHADRLANAGRLLSSAGNVAVAAFAVYSQVVKCSFMSKLPTSIRRPVCAWLIANAQSPESIKKMESAFSYIADVIQ